VSFGRLVGLIRRTGRVAQEPPPAPDPVEGPSLLRGSVQVRHVDAGSCNSCEIKIAADFGPVYDVERYGARLVASPRHADALVVTGWSPAAWPSRCGEPWRRSRPRDW
jgi:formate hydrogenlyase subunit 7